MKSVIRYWERLSKRQQLVGTIVLFGALIIGLDAAAFRPLRERLSRLRNQVKSTEQRLIDAIVATNQATSVNKAYEAYAPYIKPLDSVESEVASVLSEVESAVRETGMVQLGLRSVPGKSQASDRASVSLETEASPEQLVQLLDRLQRSKLLLRVTELQLRVSQGGSLRNTLTITKLLLPKEPAVAE